MTLPLASDVEIRAVQAATLSIFALWIGIGFVPGLGRYANLIRGVLLALYLIAAAGFILYVFLRPR
jgi:hypothetical protein